MYAQMEGLALKLVTFLKEIVDDVCLNFIIEILRLFPQWSSERDHHLKLRQWEPMISHRHISNECSHRVPDYSKHSISINHLEN